MNKIIGKKKFQAQAFLTDGTRIPVTSIEVMDNVVLSVKTIDTHGYNAVQLGYDKRKKSKKSLLGHAKKANLTTAPLIIKEAHIGSNEAFNIGDAISVDSIFKLGDIIKVTGRSKGKGFAGVVKRHNFRGGPRTHGQSDRERAPGSIGQTTTPGRVYKGKRMAGRMGNAITSSLNLEIVDIEEIDGIKRVLVKGLVPGVVNSIVTIEKTGELSEKKVLSVIKLDKKTLNEVTQDLSTVTENVVTTDNASNSASDSSVNEPVVAEKESQTTEVIETKIEDKK